MRNNLISILLLLAVPWLCIANSFPTQVQTDAVWKAIEIFEGSATTITGDFDCQGISIGIAQWNIGKSRDSVKAIIHAIPNDQLAALMPKYGQRFLTVLNGTKEDALSFVRSLQVIEDHYSCDSNIRKVRWSSEGKLFANELSRALATDSSIMAQRKLRAGIFKSGFQNATQWAQAVRGQDAVPSIREIAYFVDMQIFNGGDFSKFSLDSKPLSTTVRSVCAGQVLDFLLTADDDFLLHKKAARKNASLLKPQYLSESDTDLFCLSYHLALKLNAKHARQFRLTVINRRAAILFGKAYYSDKDSHPIEVTFATLH